MADEQERLASALADRYAIQHEVGRGGMATVYLAEDLKLGRRVAVKVLKPDLAAALGKERFLREITITARLEHPHILGLHDSGDADGLLYYVMPYVEGESLRDRLDRAKQLPLEDALQIACEVADALSYAHSHDVIHRDIKPENILLESGHAVVSDFGIARAITAAGGARLTETGVSLGTPTYMSPEQSAGEILDATTDIYSLGCVLYEMLAGEPPFTGPTAQSIMARHAVDPLPSLQTVRRAVPAGVEGAIRKAVEKVPADRFATALQFAEAIRPTAEVAAARERGRPTLPRRSVFAAVLVALLAVAGVIGFLARRGAPPLDSELVAVVPFEVLHPELELWGEGLVDVLSAGLDGAGPLRSASPTSVIRRWSGRSDRPSASALARQLGAGLVVYGRVQAAGSDSVRLSSVLLDVASGDPLGEVEVRELAARMDRAADSTAMRLLRALGRTQRIGVVRLASLGSMSLPAVRAFLRGEQAFRRGSWDSALAYHEQALELDSGFALAMRRVGQSLSWRLSTALSARVDQMRLAAGALNRGLPPRESLLVAADSIWAAWNLSPGLSSSLGRRLRDVMDTATRRYPGDAEVWHQLGEALLHVFGTGDIDDVFDAFERAVRLDSGFVPAYVHLLELGLWARGPDAWGEYARSFLSLNTPSTHHEATLVVRDIVEAAPDWPATVGQDLASRPEVVFNALTQLVAWTDSAESAIRFGHRVGSPLLRDNPEFRDRFAIALAFRGHMREALAIADTVTNPFFTGEIALVAALSGIVDSASARQLLRASAERSVLDHYLLWLGQAESVSTLEVNAGQIERFLSQAELDAENAVHARQALDRVLAYLSLARHDTTDALRRFMALSDTTCLLCLHRLTRVQLLMARGRNEEAVLFLRDPLSQLFGALGTPLTVAWTLERGRVHDRLGNRAQAIEAYAHVAAAWRHADPELQPLVVEAREAIARLTGRRG